MNSSIGPDFANIFVCVVQFWNRVEYEKKKFVQLQLNENIFYFMSVLRMCSHKLPNIVYLHKSFQRFLFLSFLFSFLLITYDYCLHQDYLLNWEFFCWNYSQIMVSQTTWTSQAE